MRTLTITRENIRARSALITYPIIVEIGTSIAANAAITVPSLTNVGESTTIAAFSGYTSTFTCY